MRLEGADQPAGLVGAGQSKPLRTLSVMEWIDRSVLEAVSWRLASELMRRHPDTLRLIRAHPGGGLSDCLWLLPINGKGGDLRLNRNGTIQILERFDGRPADQWRPTDWEEYIGADPREFLHRLEVAAGLPAPPQVPPATPVTLTYRVLAAIASTAVKSVHPIDIQPGVIDTSGYGGGANKALDPFLAISDELLDPLDDDLNWEPGYRFWIVHRDDVPVLAFEQRAGLAWTSHHTVSFSLMALYEESRRHLLVTAMKLLRRVDQV